MRIELVLLSLVRAGMEVVTVELGVRLNRRGHDVGVTCIHGKGELEDRLSEAGIRLSLVEVPGLRANLLTGRLARHFGKVGPDIVHSHSGAWLKVALAAKRAGVSGVVHTIHGRTRDRLLMYLGARFTDAVAAVSEPLREYLIQGVRIPRRKVITVVNGVDETHFSPEGPAEGPRARLGLSKDTVLVGTVARFSAVKDHATLLDAFDGIRRLRSRAHLVLIGDGELRSEIEAKIEALSMGAQVHLVGSVEDTAPLYRDLDVFVLSSLNEGTSISVLEALASGLPVIATCVGGNPYLIENGVQGLLVPSANPTLFGHALAQLLDDRELRRTMGQAARRRVEAELTLGRMVDRYEAIYQATIQQSD